MPNKIAVPKHLGGWGLKDLRTFGRSLICKTLHRGIFGTGPWSKTIQFKYLNGRALLYWYRRGAIGTRGGSAIWRSLKTAEHFFLSKLKWQIHSGTRILLGIDPIASKQAFFLPDHIIAALHQLGFFTWDKVILEWHGSSPVWKTAEQLGLPPPLSPVWLQVLSSLQIAGIARCGPSDHLRWSSTSSSASISVKDVYSELIFTLAPTPAPIFPSTLWKSGCPPRMIYFAWLLFNNRNLTWDNLIKRSWHGPSRCYICESDEESNLHIFFCCRLTLDLWCELARLYSFPHVEFDSVQAAYNWWTSQPAKRRPLLIITVWFIWPWRNHRIFYSIKTPLHTILPCICSLRLHQQQHINDHNSQFLFWTLF